MSELLRDTTLGHFLRIVTQQTALPYPEERDPSLWKRYVDNEKSGNMAQHGGLVERDEDKEGEETNGNSDDDAEQSVQGQDNLLQGHNGLPIARNSSDTRLSSQDGAEYNEVSGVRIDPEKGRDATIVTWYSDNDPEVSVTIWSMS